MAEWVVFGSGTPAAPNETDGPIAVATGFVINDAVTYWCTGVEFFAPTVAPTGVEVALWQRIDDATPGTQLAVEAAGGAITPGVRNRIMFDTAVPVSAALYPAGMYAVMRSANRYVATGAYFTSSGETSGPITAYQHGAGFGPNGRFNVGAGGAAYPNGQFNAGGYWVSPIITDEDPEGATDVVVTDAGPRGARAGGSPATAAAGVVLVDGGPRGAAAGGSPATVVVGVPDVAVVDASGGLRAGGSPATAAAGATSIPDPAVWPLLVQVLACLDEAVDAVDAPPLYRSIRTGDSIQASISPSQDECCEGLAWVRPVGITPTNAFPTPESGWQPCPPAELAVEIELGVVRCAPFTAEGSTSDELFIVTSEQWALLSYRIMADAAAMRRAVCCLIDLGYSVSVGNWSPLATEANCAGGSQRITVAVPFCERTC